jgi:small conductance mechanosensitive channel
VQPIPWLQKGTEWLAANWANFAVDLLVLILILIVGKIAISGICRVTERVLNRARQVSEILESFTIELLRKLLWIIVLMIALGQVGINVAPLIAGLGIAGFILGFAFQETLGNLASGLMVLINQPFNKGDFIEAGGVAGTVQDLNLMATTLTTPDNKKVVVPNSAIWGASITNYSAMDTRRVDMVIGISYGSDIGKARDIISGILTANEQVLDDPEPTIEVVEMADSSVNLVVRPWCNTPDYWAVYFAVNRAVKETFDREGIEIPFPQMDVHHHGQPASS